MIALTRIGRTRLSRAKISRAAYAAARLGCAAIVPLSLAHGVHAQEATQSTSSSQDPALAQLSLEEVIVTARKRSELLQDVPMSILAVSEETLENAGVNAMNELFRIAPGLVLTEGTGGANAALTLRGLGTFSFATGAIDPTISTAVDGVVSGVTGGGGLTDFSDVERIEVLRGPQGTLFGKNSSGGLVHVITKDPTEDLSANLGFEYSPTYRRNRINGAISGPIAGEELLGRLSFFSTSRDGYIRNVLDGRMVGDDNQLGLRGKLLFTPGEATRLKLSASRVERDRPDSFEQNLVRGVDDSTFVLVRDFNSDLASPTNDRMRGFGRTVYEEEINDISLQWDQSFGDFTLTSITAYGEWLYDQNPDGQVPLNEVPVAWVTKTITNFDQSQWSQEVRLASPEGGLIDYVVGVYAFEQKFLKRADALLDLSLLGVPSTYLGFNVDDEINTSNYAGFGELNLNLSESFTVIAGARWTREKKDLDHKALPMSAPGGATVIPIGASGFPDTTEETSASELTWRAGVRWEPSADHMLYATVATGFKGPAFNINASSELPNVLITVDPETSLSYETGWKGMLMDDRVRVGVALFLTELEDFQAQGREFVTMDDGLRIGFDVLKNAGRVESKGAEIDLQAAPTDSLLFNANLAYTDAKYDEYLNAPCYSQQTAERGCVGGVQDLSGTRLARAPKWAGNVGAQYAFPLGALSYQGLARLDYSWRDEIDWAFNGAPNATEGSLGLLAASIGIRDSHDRYSLIVYGENLTDEFHTNGISGGANAGTHTLLPEYRRIWGIRLECNFD